MSISDEAVEAAAEALRVAEERYENDSSPQPWEGVARAVLEAAAPYMHREVTSVAELDALADGDVILSDEGGVFEREHGWWRVTGSRDPMASSEICLPATIIHEGTK